MGEGMEMSPGAVDGDGQGRQSNTIRSIVFDCDSTLSRMEGIDELAGEHADEIRALTDAAMEGEIPLEEVYGRRLDIIRPTRQRLEEIGRMYIDRAVDDAHETVAALRWLGKDVRVISGGLQPPVEALASSLGLSTDAVSAVGIQFAEDGSYAGFEADSPLARNGGKPEVVRAWGLSRDIMMVGDGATDLEAAPEVDLFVAFMGVAFRDRVAEAADVVISECTLAPVLALAADSADKQRLRDSPWAGVLERGEAILAGQTAH